MWLIARLRVELYREIRWKSWATKQFEQKVKKEEAA